MTKLINNQWRNRRGAECPPETSESEISADLAGKSSKENKLKSWEERRKDGKLKMEGKVLKRRKDLFFFVLFCFDFCFCFVYFCFCFCFCLFLFCFVLFCFVLFFLFFLLLFFFFFFFLFFFFVLLFFLHFSKRLKFVLCVPKWKFSTGKKAFHAGKKNQEK